MKEKIIVFVLILIAIGCGVMAIVNFPTPQPLSEQEKEATRKEIAEKTEWSVHGNTMTAKFPLFEISKNNPRIRIVRSTTLSKKGGYEIESNSIYPEISFSWDAGRIVRDYANEKSLYKMKKE